MRSRLVLGSIVQLNPGTLAEQDMVLLLLAVAAALHTAPSRSHALTCASMHLSCRSAVGCAPGEEVFGCGLVTGSYHRTTP